jgi:enoyl-CoA hydratase/carnithine racemase
MDEILIGREAGIATVVLNRPHKLNAMTRPMVHSTAHW